MDSLIFAFSAIAPIVLFVLLGYFLKKTGLFKKDLSVALNRLVFTVFLPIHLFISIYKLDSFDGIDPSYIAYTLIFTVLLFAVSIPLTMLTAASVSMKASAGPSCCSRRWAMITWSSRRASPAVPPALTTPSTRV